MNTQTHSTETRHHHHQPHVRLNGLSARLAHVIPAAEVLLHLPLLERIATLKAQHDAVIVAHNYQTPLITQGIADFTGDSLAMARYAAQCTASTIVVCGVYFMAESVKLLCSKKRVLIPNLNAGCSLAESIGAEDVRTLRRQHPGIPVVAYVNTSAAVKAEADVCCTSANAIEVALSLAKSMGVPKLIMVPDQHLAHYVASQTGLEIISWNGQCDVHVKYAAVDIAAYRKEQNAVVLAHPECPREVCAQSDFVGSTSAMSRYLREHRPARVLLLTECAMADNVSVDHPEIEFLRPCNLCSHMKSITLTGVADVLEHRLNEIQLEPLLTMRARSSLQRMLAL